MEWVLAVIQVLYVILCLLLIVVILLQAGKGGGMGVAFGGAASQSMFTSTGAGNFLTRLTSILAIFFMIFSLILSWSSSKTGSERLKKASKAIPTVNQILDETLGATTGDATEQPAAPAATGDATEQPAAPAATGDATEQPAAPAATGDATEQPAAPAATGDATAQPAAPAQPVAPAPQPR